MDDANNKSHGLQLGFRGLLFSGVVVLVLSYWKVFYQRLPHPLGLVITLPVLMAFVCGGMHLNDTTWRYICKALFNLEASIKGFYVCAVLVYGLWWDFSSFGQRCWTLALDWVLFFSQRVEALQCIGFGSSSAFGGWTTWAFAQMSGEISREASTSTMAL